MSSPYDRVNEREYDRDEDDALDHSPKALAKVLLRSQTTNRNVEERNKADDHLSRDDPALAEASYLACF